MFDTDSSSIGTLYLAESGDPLNTPTQGCFAMSLHMEWLFKAAFDLAVLA